MKGVRRIKPLQLRQEPAGILDEYIAAIAAGDQQALATLYEHVSSGAYAFALSTLKNSHDAEDVLHDCLVSIWSSAWSASPIAGSRKELLL